MALLDELFSNRTAGQSNLVENASVIGRNIGKELESILKPDGSISGSIAAGAASLAQGAADVVTGLTENQAIDKIVNGASQIKKPPQKTATKGGTALKNIVPNPLENFASFTPLFTMAVLTPDQFNVPSLYRTESAASLSNIIFSSAGRFDNQRVNTFFGTPEYFVDNFNIRSTISATEKTGNSNAVKIDFEVYEPYSFGLFLQSCQNAAINAGYSDYLDNTPYVLRLDIVGFDERGQRLGAPSAGGFLNAIRPKFYVLKLVSMKFDVNEGGSSYKIEAIPFNHQAFADVTNTLFTDIKISPDKKGTVKEVLVSGPDSLCSVLNKNEERLVAEKRIKIPDVYEIQFPQKSSDFISSSQPSNIKRATASPTETPKTVVSGTNVEVQTDFGDNPIGESKFGFEQGKGGNFVFKKEGDVRDEKTGLITRDKMTIDPKARSFHFAQGQSLNDIIVQIILSSDYVKQAMDPENITDDGFIKWFRLDIQIELLNFDDLTGGYARKIIFRVVPFFVHHSIFSNPNTPSIGLPKLEEKICKRYDYIYTGQNVDILKFDISINNLFYTGRAPVPESATATEVNKNQQGIAATPTIGTKAGEGSDPKTQTANAGRARSFADPDAPKRIKGGAKTQDTAQLIAQQFHDAFVKGTSQDLVSVDLEILGDPYWLVDGGMANYFSKPASDTAQITEDGTANYEGIDVYVYLTFKSPADLDEASGMYQFASVGRESPFGGIYRVVMCESMFSEGLFKQKLKCLRLQKQPQDFDNETRDAEKTEATTTKLDEEKPLPSALYSDIPARLRR